MSDSSAATVDRALASGAVIGHYEVLSFVGAGGMGEVYRVRDTRLGRDVALKILPDAYGRDPDRIRRFTLEARTTSRLNHPNIVSMFDVGDHEGRPYIVTELLEGQTLRSLLQETGPLPVRRAVEIAVQVARGLAAAHEKSVIHRDLKPANVFIGRDGHVKILDFGLAKLVRPEWEEPAGADSDTISGVSLPGVLLGSVGYMAPEQVEARPVDHRADIFAFGATMYELLTATRAFSGSSVPATLGAILKEDPLDLSLVRPGVPAALTVIVARCLQKRPSDRFQSARDLAFSLEELTSRSDTSSISSAALAAVRAAVHSVERRPARSAMAIAAVGLLAWTTSAFLRPSTIAASPPSSRPELVRLTSSGMVGDSVAMSSDARYVAYSIVRGGGLWLMHVPSRSSTRVVSGSVSLVRFSPDGNFIYFVSDDNESSLYRIPLLGGTAQRIAKQVINPIDESSLTFTRDGGRIAYIRTTKDGNALFSAAADGSGERAVVKFGKDDFLVDCAWSPDATSFACAVLLSGGPSLISVDAVTGARQSLVPTAETLHAVEWTPDGAAIIGTTPHVAGSQLWRVDYPSGVARPVTSDLSRYGDVTISSDGSTLATSRLDSTVNLWRVSVATGELRQLTSGANTLDGNFGVTVAPDHSVVWASDAAEKSVDLWVADAEMSSRRRLTFDDAFDEKWPHVSPDCKYVVFVRQSRGDQERATDVWRVNFDGSNPVRLTSMGSAGPPRVSADGRRVFFAGVTEGEQFAYEVPIDGGLPTRVGDRPSRGPAPSPDGRWLLTTLADPKSGYELELRPIDGVGDTRRLGVREAMKKWRPDSGGIAFLRSGGGSLNVFAMDLDGKPRQVTRFEREGDGVAWGFDWTPDGKSIVFARRTDTREVVLIKGIQ